MKDDAVDAVYSTTTKTRGKMRLCGNVRGRANRHYQWSRKGESGEPGFAYHRLTADDAIAGGLFSETDLEMARRSLPAAVFRELYYCEPADDGQNPFGIDAVRACAELNNGQPTGNPVRVWGLDIARKRDYAVLMGLDSHRHVSVMYRWHGLSYSSLVSEVTRIVGPGNKACLFFDATGVGDAVGEQLSSARLWCEAFIFSSASKQGLMEGLALALQQGRTSVLDGPHRAELEAFEYDVKQGRVVYGAPSGVHDDTVCAHALAWYGAERMGVTAQTRRAYMGSASTTPSRGTTW
jgi:phage FluMu gp28-like protein